jgi:hypothetical protein
MRVPDRGQTGGSSRRHELVKYKRSSAIHVVLDGALQAVQRTSLRRSIEGLDL